MERGNALASKGERCTPAVLTLKAPSHPAPGQQLLTQGAMDVEISTLRSGGWVAAVLVCALVTPADAQTHAVLAAPPSGMPAPVSLTIRRLVPEVQMLIAAQNHQGRPVLNLKARQIKVLDNGLTAPLSSLQPASTLPLRIGLLVDTGDSMRPRFAAEHQAALALVRQLRQSCCDEALSMTFAAGESATEASPTTFAAGPGGQTALYDALIASSTELVSSSTQARRVLLLLSDGEDTYSRASLPEAIATLQRSAIAVYAISVHSSRLVYPGDRVLRQVAAATGGRAFLLASYTGATKVLFEVEGELRAQYLIGFRPMSKLTAGEFHSVNVKPLVRGMVIRARPGYYVTAPQ